MSQVFGILFKTANIIKSKFNGNLSGLLNSHCKANMNASSRFISFPINYTRLIGFVFLLNHTYAIHSRITHTFQAFKQHQNQKSMTCDEIL